jgi:Ran GTPase-activating protein (RanGAP) involved in mRNA processing and transport
VFIFQGKGPDENVLVKGVEYLFKTLLFCGGDYDDEPFNQPWIRGARAAFVRQFRTTWLVQRAFKCCFSDHITERLDQSGELDAAMVHQWAENNGNYQWAENNSNILNHCLIVSRGKLAQRASKFCFPTPTKETVNKTLDMTNNVLGDGGAKGIAKLIAAKNSSWTSINLSNSEIGDEGAKAIARALEGNETLKELNLRENAVGDEGAKAIGKALERNETLKELNLRENAFGDEGAKAIARALEGNETLKNLNILGNTFGEEGATALMPYYEIMRQTIETSLGWKGVNSEKWDLSRKKLTDGDMLLIEPLLSTMRNLESINLRENNFGD